MDSTNSDDIQTSEGAARDERQADVFVWAQAAFSVEQATSLPQRGLRLLEEVIEAFQAVGGDPVMAHKLVDYVFARPVGELGQELGGIGVTLLALAAAAGLSADDAERLEVERVLAKPLEHFRQRNAAKVAAGFLAVAAVKDGSQATARVGVAPGYELLAAVLDEALQQAQEGKGRERHGFSGDAFEEQTIVAINEKIGSIDGQVYQVCKKAIEATRLPPDRARRDLLGAINYLVAAIIQIDRRSGRRIQ